MRRCAPPEANRKGCKGFAKNAKKKRKGTDLMFFATFAKSLRSLRSKAVQFRDPKTKISEPAAAQVCHVASLKHSIPVES
jgi:hypothetical protein